jgi:cation:H+ antiporter
MEILLWVLIFIGTLFVLVKSADYFTEYSEKLGLMLGLSSFIIGATIVAVGTSLPELVSSLYAVIGTGATEFVADSIIGSNIANALLILGIGAVVAILFFVAFVVYSVKAEDEPKDKDEMQDLEEQYEEEEDRKLKVIRALKYSGYIAISMVLIAFSAKYFIDSLLNLSQIIGISSSLLTVSVVAIGTSLPEVLTSIAAIKLGNHGMAIGNVFGSNTFNIALVGSVPAFFATLDINPTTFAIGIPFLIFATLVAIFATMDNKVQIWEGIAMLFLYAVFMGKIFGLV